MAFDYSRIKAWLANSGTQSAKDGKNVKFNAVYQTILGLITGAEQFSNDISDLQITVEGIGTPSPTVETIDGVADAGITPTFSRGDHKHGFDWAGSILGDILYRAAGVWTLLVGNTVASRKFLSQTGTGAVSAAPSWQRIIETDIDLSDNTTNDVTIAKHGFVPKAPNDTTKFLRGDATWAVKDDYVVASDGGTPTPLAVDDGFGNFIYVTYTP